MSSIEQCQYDIQRCQILKAEINGIISKLNSAANHTSSLDYEIKNSYQVDGGNAIITNQTASLKNDLEDTANYLKNTILPSIDSSISDANREIEYLEEEERKQQEEEERKRQEEERKRQKEEAN